MLDSYKSGKGKWQACEKKLRVLMASRKIEKTLPRAALDGACLLRGEAKPDACHRRVVAEYLKAKWSGVEIVHLGGLANTPVSPDRRRPQRPSCARTSEDEGVARQTGGQV